MNAELKARWVAALRSGEWKQCTGYLRDGDAYCCLGVLHKIVTGQEPAKAWNGDRPMALDFIDEKVDGMQLQIKLVAMNDGRDTHLHSFAEIADYIERNL